MSTWDGKVASHRHKVTLGEMLPWWCPKHKWWRFSEISPYILLQSQLTWLFPPHVHLAWLYPTLHGHSHLTSTLCDQFATSYVRWECPCKVGNGHARWGCLHKVGNGHARWTQGENVHATWEMIMQDGKWSCEVRIWSHKMDGKWECLYEVDARWECPHEVGNGYMRWMWGVNGHIRWLLHGRGWRGQVTHFQPKSSHIHVRWQSCLT